VQSTDSDRRLLSFLAEHQRVRRDQVEVLLGVSAQTAGRRLASLGRARLIRADRSSFPNQPGTYQVTQRGLDAIGSDLRSPGRDSRSPQHDIGLGWLWLAARDGTFGPLQAIVSERRMRSHDGTEDGRDEPFGVRLTAGRDGLHYPDLLLSTDGGRHIALELELTRKARSRLEKILAGYAADPRIDAVVYLFAVDQPQIGRAIQASARRLGISDLIHVQRVRWGDAEPAPAQSARTAERSRSSAQSASGDVVEASR
jgi:hypothetical protein